MRGLRLGELSVEISRFLVWQLEAWWPGMLTEGEAEWVDGGR